MEVVTMTANYFEYREMTEKIFYGIQLTDNHLNHSTEKLRQYLVNGGAGEILQKLNIGIKVITKEALLLPKETIYERFVWLDGNKKGEELDRHEIEGIGLFLKHGAYENFFNHKTQ